MKLKEILFLAMLSICISCNYSKLKGTLGVSKDINDSKNRNVFVAEIEIPNMPVVINDTLSITVKSAWLEHQWRYDGLNNEKSKNEKDGYHLILITNEKSIKGYGENWMIGTTGKNSFRLASRDALIIDLDSIPKDKLFNWDVQDSNQLSPSIKKNIIGKFSLKPKM